MAIESLRCKECGAEYPLDARYVCDRCFGPLEVAYDYGDLDVAEVRRKIQAGPRSIWRYGDFLPFATTPRGTLTTGTTPLLRADRLAERLGLGEVYVKNDAANPTHSFKDRVVSVALAKAIELGFEVVACASTGNLANAVATGAQPAACAPLKVGSSPSSSPSSSHSAKPRPILVNSDPEATGATTRSGSVNASCSAIS